ncbi:hypothetical protein P168DRAFT_2480 [Aspergillus campestris IBT 28561]|uniref:Uncharacterized protein n=1 Tax=Aspergillus campestris (strain IBT 28561) TaxID=1392248 RepID=A0A2I1DD59_ASPC2|nr:uncharacterized protein P168DRAFT_2480 [Aspergillus campestris IBT 28561]PKY07795.1 hypothetical protein P168DRAFT_2480 [Aspergillus campestris IBT 28561]
MIGRKHRREKKQLKDRTTPRLLYNIQRVIVLLFFLFNVWRRGSYRFRFHFRLYTSIDRFIPFVVLSSHQISFRSMYVITASKKSWNSAFFCIIHSGIKVFKRIKEVLSPCAVCQNHPSIHQD